VMDVSTALAVFREVCEGGQKLTTGTRNLSRSANKASAINAKQTFGMYGEEYTELIRKKRG
jgi:hypothetical protein